MASAGAPLPGAPTFVRTAGTEIGLDAYGRFFTSYVLVVGPSAAAAAAGSSAGNVLQLRVYVRGELGDYMEILAPMMSKYFGASRPALTGIGVASLASPETLIEIEALARVGDE